MDLRFETARRSFKRLSSRRSMAFIIFILFAMTVLDINELGRQWRNYRASADFNYGYKALKLGDKDAARQAFEKAEYYTPESIAARAYLATATATSVSNSTSHNETHLSETINDTMSVEGFPVSASPPDILDLSSKRRQQTAPPLITVQALPDRLTITLPAIPFSSTKALAPTKAPKPSQTYAFNEQGFQSIRAKQTPAAIKYFEASLSLDPQQSLIWRQLAYLHQESGNNTSALEAFDQALKLGGLDPYTQFLLERETAVLDQSFHLSSYNIWRANARDPVELAGLGPSLGQSQSGIETGYSPDLTAFLNTLQPDIFARLLWGYNGNTLNFDTATTQAGIGLRLRPLRKHDFSVAAERLISIGNAARNDWLLRSSWSKGTGFTPPFDQRSWLFWSLYLDAAVIRPQNPDFFLSGEARIGQSFSLTPQNQTTLTPFIGLHTSLQDAQTTTILTEASLGLWLQQYYRQTSRRRYTSAFDLRAAYRTKVAGNSASTSGPVITLAFHY